MRLSQSFANFFGKQNRETKSSESRSGKTGHKCQYVVYQTVHQAFRHWVIMRCKWCGDEWQLERGWFQQAHPGWWDRS